MNLDLIYGCALRGGGCAVPGQATPIRKLSVRALLPDTDHYMTYEGSTTHPGCWETTVWILLNKPIYITRQEVRPAFPRPPRPRRLARRDAQVSCVCLCSCTRCAS